MKILGIDFGLKNMGLAVSFNGLVEPFGQMKFKNLQKALSEIQKFLKEEKIKKVVMGISEGEIGEKTREFASKLEKKTKIPVFLEDESFTSFEAKKKLLEIKKPRKKRQKEEHQIAACLLLENFLARMKN